MSGEHLRVTGVAAGGDGVGRTAEGKVVFLPGALPGETVTFAPVEERRSFTRGVVTSIVEASVDRRRPPCPYVAEGCGGCDWQHVAPPAQPGFKAQVVIDALERIGGIGDPLVEPGEALSAEGHRTTVRCGIVDGRAAYRRRASHDLLAVERCLVAHPLVDELITEGRFGGATEVTLRAGARTGERLVLAHPSAQCVVVPDDVIVVGTDELRNGRRAWYHEEVAGRRYRISATSFFPARPDGAEALIDAARRATAADGPPDGALIDLFCGVGLFAGALGAGRPVVAVERHGPAVHDARHNLSGHRGGKNPVKVVRAGLDRWRPSPADVVIADPARSGLGRRAVTQVAATGARRVVLVSCDPASLGRDARLLADAGYRFMGSTLVDLFPHTAHVEVVTRFDLEGPVEGG
ncbi:class I SAM-dependent RNA methyltransferase [soil metagenome]